MGSQGFPYLRPDMISSLLIPKDVMVANANGEKTQFLGVLERLRQSRLINPIEYVSLQAAVEGVPCIYADVNRRESRAFWKTVGEIVAGYAAPRAILTELRAEKLEMKYRDIKTVARLGSTALTMDRTDEQVPVLSYAGGRAHQSNLERILHAQGVGFSSQAFSPVTKRRLRRDTLRTFASIVVPGLGSADERYRDLWLKNALEVERATTQPT
jgi:hypothetical protein